jgi:hypothetical protein
MKNLLRILFLLIILAGVGLWVFYHTHKEAINDNLRNRMEVELSLITGRDVSIGSARYDIFGNIRLERLLVDGTVPSDTVAYEADAVNISIDIPSLLKDKQLIATFDVEGFMSDGMLADISFRSYSRKAGSYKNVFDPALVYSLFITRGDLRTSGIIVRNVVGKIDTKGFELSRAKVGFRCKDTDYLATITTIRDEKKTYAFELGSSGLELNARIAGDKEAVNILAMEGLFQNLRFRMSGIIDRPLKDDMSGEVSGSFSVDLSSLADLIPGPDKKARNFEMEGPVSADLTIKITQDNIAKWDVSAEISGEDLVINTFYLKNVSASLSIEEGRLSTSSVTGALYDGALSGKIKIDLREKNLPFALYLDLKDLDFGRMMLDISQDNSGMFGDINMDLELKGYINDNSTFRGHGSVTVSEANLGQMPLLTPLLGDIYMKMQGIFAPEARTGDINSAYADFEVKDREISTDNLTFIGDDIAISSRGSLDFDGNLDFVFENTLLEKTEEESYEEDWQVTLRNIIINAGKIISKSKLRGTLSKPEWGL